MKLPDGVREGVEGALREADLGRRIEAVHPVGGGCINHGARVETDSSRTAFLKWNRSSPEGMFEAEADGLLALAAATSVRVPRPLAFGDDGSGTAWLLMEHVAAGSPRIETQRALGQGLAEMHTAAALPTFGWERDNWIGSLDQRNDSAQSWGDFWRDHRIAPQLEMARRRGLAGDATFDRVLEVTPHALREITRPELVHGDLWGGNWFAGEGGEPVLIDPAVYRGHGEVDLAMSELFGGFGPAFYEAYEGVSGPVGAYTAYRKNLYQLYYLLVHVNLFGGAYAAASLQAARAVTDALG